MSAFYFDVLKDRLYTAPTRSRERRSAQTALWHVLDAFTRLAAPILPFTAEEVWRASHEGEGDIDSVHAQILPAYPDEYDNGGLLEEWEKLSNVRDVVLKALDEARQGRRIGSALEAKVLLHAPPDVGALLARHAADLRYIFIVSQVEVLPSASEASLRVEVVETDGDKCERCWNYSPEVGSFSDYPTLCERCAPVARELAGAPG